MYHNKTKPIFYYHNDINNEIKAGGIIFYHYDKHENDLKFLMINKNNIYEDFGGKTSLSDAIIEETVAREVEEESNSIFSKKSILTKIVNKTPLYTKNSKYLLYFCKLKNIEYFNPTIFGDKEFYDNIPRTVEWISIAKLNDNIFRHNNLNYRLRFKSFFDKINKINNFYSYKCKNVNVTNYSTSC